MSPSEGFYKGSSINEVTQFLDILATPSLQFLYYTVVAKSLTPSPKGRGVIRGRSPIHLNNRVNEKIVFPNKL